MPGLCTECLARNEYLGFRKVASELEASLRGQYGSGIDPGGRAFLGRHYAHSRRILFTLNPRPNPNRQFSAQLLENNRHWEGEAKAPYRNWTFARHLFSNMAASAEWVTPAITHMTDQFIVPWPSKDWRSMEKSPAWPTIREYSAELCRLSLRHHQPDLVFISGKTSFRLFFQFIGVSPPKVTDRRAPANKSWTCEWFQLVKRRTLRHFDFAAKRRASSAFLTRQLQGVQGHRRMGRGNPPYRQLISSQGQSA